MAVAARLSGARDSLSDQERHRAEVVSQGRQAVTQCCPKNGQHAAVAVVLNERGEESYCGGRGLGPEILKIRVDERDVQPVCRPETGPRCSSLWCRP